MLVIGSEIGADVIKEKWKERTEKDKDNHE